MRRRFVLLLGIVRGELVCSNNAEVVGSLRTMFLDMLPLSESVTTVPEALGVLFSAAAEEELSTDEDGLRRIMLPTPVTVVVVEVFIVVLVEGFARD